MYYLASNATHRFAYNSVTKAVDVKSPDTIKSYPIIYFNVLILILSIYILFQWGNLLGFPIFYARFQVNQNVSSVKLCF